MALRNDPEVEITVFLACGFVDMKHVIGVGMRAEYNDRNWYILTIALDNGQNLELNYHEPALAEADYELLMSAKKGQLSSERGLDL